MATPNFTGRPPTPELEELVKGATEQWRKVANEAPVQAISRIEDAAKQLVTLTGLLQGLYFAVFAFSGLHERITNRGLLLFATLPVGLWLVSLCCATLVFVPRVWEGTDLDNQSPGAWLALRDTYYAVSRQKLARLHWAHGFLIASFGVVFALLLALAFVPAAPAPRPTEIIIVTPTPTRP